MGGGHIHREINSLGKLFKFRDIISEIGENYFKFGKSNPKKKNGNWRKAYCVINQSNFEHELNLNANQILKKRPQRLGISGQYLYSYHINVLLKRC